MTTTKKHQSLFLCLIILIYSCSSKISPWAKGGCPLERFEWMKVTTGYDKNTVIELASKIEAAAKADAAQIKQIAEGNANVSFSASLKSVVDRSAATEVNVSREFYESYVKYRSSMCAIWQGIKSKTLTGDIANKQAQELYLEIAKDFAIVKVNEEKKSQ
nr:hypothetical protein [uncultured Flavobacterium sp.]